MDIVITLPKDLWYKIVSGEKKTEVRKWDLPKHFDLKFDNIYVVLKGTRKVVGCFKVVNVDMFYFKGNAWKKYGDSLGVSKEWFFRYWGDSFVMYFFVIGDCRVLSCYNLEVAHAPQKYMKLDKAWECFLHLKYNSNY